MAVAFDVPGLDVSCETLEKLHHFAELTAKWTQKINLVAPNTVPDLWSRHIVDSAQLAPLAPEGWERWVDIGSGGGFPGIVVAIFAEKDQSVTLVESDTRKSTFLRTAIRELSLPATVQNHRVESLETKGFDVISARALAPLDVLMGYATRLLMPDGIALFPKGENYASELASARQNWDFEDEALPSITHPDARIIRLKRISRRGS